MNIFSRKIRAILNKRLSNIVYRTYLVHKIRAIFNAYYKLIFILFYFLFYFTRIIIILPRNCGLLISVCVFGAKVIKKTRIFCTSGNLNQK